MNGDGAGAAWEEDDDFDGSDTADEGKRNGTSGDFAVATSSTSLSPAGQGQSESGGEIIVSSSTQEKTRNRHGRWESGKGRCPITGRRVLGGTEGLRRVLL